MISFFFKFSLTFVISFFILSFQVNNKTIFSHLYTLIGPLGKDVQSSLQKSVNKSYEKSKKIGQEFFSNSDPKFTDTINSQRSSTAIKESHGMILEELEQDDVEKLDRIIKSQK